LPHFVGQDFADVLDDLKRAGYPFDPEWFAAHQEFRFPLIGHVAYRGIEIELRQALEPWHVMGEDAVAGGTARFVDSSVERL
ncbi:transglutaminase family protein, partial [Acinetobacter baumannii]